MAETETAVDVHEAPPRRERFIEKEVKRALARSNGRYIGISVSPELHAELLRFAVSTALVDMLDNDGFIARTSLEGAAMAVIAMRYFDSGIDDPPTDKDLLA
ncbi:MAG TPA: hypothetical protein VG476_04505 [Acidimicrobiales bacterium]|nr:hypothetical protein [Acidimicrobiales bacterium]